MFKKNKIIKMLSLFSVIFIIAISSFAMVSAADIDSDDADLNDIEINSVSSVLNYDDNITDQISLENENKVIGFSEFQKELNSGNFINLTYDVKIKDNEINEFSQGLHITKSTTIIGNNHVIDGANSVRLFNVDPNVKLEIKRASLINGYTNKDLGPMDYVNCIHTVKYDSVYRGLPAVFNSKAHVDARYCSFMNNRAYYTSNATSFTELQKDLIRYDCVELTHDIKVRDDEVDKFIHGINVNYNNFIKGNGHVIDGNNVVRLFNVSNNVMLTIDNTTLSNGFETKEIGNPHIDFVGYSDKINCGVNGYSAVFNPTAHVTVINSHFVHDRAYNLYGYLNEINNENNLTRYLEDDANCNITPEIQALSDKLTVGFDNYTKVYNLHNYVCNSIDYEFYYNTIKGASNTLLEQEGNDCDKSHLLVSLARAAGIPARYNHGRIIDHYGLQYAHVWVQLLLDDIWVCADTSFYYSSLGENGCKVVNMYNNTIDHLKF